MKAKLAVLAAKAAALAAGAAGGKSSSMPGAVALRICPNLIEVLSKQVRKGIIVTCGTNGKTTTNNLMCSALEGKGYKVVCNKLGANMINGVATAFALAAGSDGRIDADYAAIMVTETTLLSLIVIPILMMIVQLDFLH